MSFQINTKKPIPTEQETKTKILTAAKIIGCYVEAKRILDANEYRVKGSINDPKALFQAAAMTIIDLCKLDTRLVSWLANENGEIVVGGQVIVKIEIKPTED